jgi:hypothetical protein
MPSGFTLFNYFPNPFNPQTTIKYHLNENRDVTLRLFDVSGKEVETIFKGHQLSGKHHFIRQAKGKPSGTIFLK